MESFAITRLERQNIDYIIQPVGNDRLNLFFGKKECLDAIRMIVTKPLCQLTPEEFILGAMLGYDICAQCERYCRAKEESLLSFSFIFEYFNVLTRKSVIASFGDHAL